MQRAPRDAFKTHWNLDTRRISQSLPRLHRPYHVRDNLNAI
jgi:hypothetical protein